MHDTPPLSFPIPVLPPPVFYQCRIVSDEDVTERQSNGAWQSSRSLRDLSCANNYR